MVSVNLLAVQRVFVPFLFFPTSNGKINLFAVRSHFSTADGKFLLIQRRGADLFFFLSPFSKTEDTEKMETSSPFSYSGFPFPRVGPRLQIFGFFFFSSTCHKRDHVPFRFFFFLLGIYKATGPCESVLCLPLPPTRFRHFSFFFFPFSNQYSTR